MLDRLIQEIKLHRPLERCDRCNSLHVVSFANGELLCAECLGFEKLAQLQETSAAVSSAIQADDDFQDATTRLQVAALEEEFNFLHV